MVVILFVMTKNCGHHRGKKQENRDDNRKIYQMRLLVD